MRMDDEGRWCGMSTMGTMMRGLLGRSPIGSSRSSSQGGPHYDQGSDGRLLGCCCCTAHCGGGFGAHVGLKASPWGPPSPLGRQPQRPTLLPQFPHLHVLLPQFPHLHAPHLMCPLLWPAP